MSMTDRVSAHAILVRVPATVGNVAGSGAGAALALDASMNVKVTPRTDGQVRIRYFGENGDCVPRDYSNLIVQAMRSALSARQKPFMGASIEVYSSIPIGAGLGASAAAVWAGLIAANSLFDLYLDEQLLFALATTLESRKDNLHAAWFGGLAVLTGIGETYRTASVPEALQLEIVIPTLVEELRPSQPLLPATRYSDGARADSIRRAAAVANFLGQGARAGPLRLESTVPGSPLVAVPGLEEALRMSAPGTLATFICGSGPAVGVLSENGFSPSIEAVRHCFSRCGVPTQLLEVRSSPSGARDWNSMYSLEPRVDAEPVGAVAATCWQPVATTRPIFSASSSTERVYAAASALEDKLCT